MPHLIECDNDRPVSPASPPTYRRESSSSGAPPTAITSSSHRLPNFHQKETNVSKTKSNKSWWASWGEPASDRIPDVIDTSSSSRDVYDISSSGVLGYEDDDDEDCELPLDVNAAPPAPRQQQRYRYVLGAPPPPPPPPPPPMSPPSRNQSSSSNSSLFVGRGRVPTPRDLEVDGSDDDDNYYRDDDHRRRTMMTRRVHEDDPDRENYSRQPVPPMPSPSARSIRSSKQKDRRSHRRSLVERRRSQTKHQPYSAEDDEQQPYHHRSSSSSSSGAGTWTTSGATSSHSHPSRSSHGGGGGSRRSSSHHHSASSDGTANHGGQRHSIARRSSASAARRKSDPKDRFGSALAHSGKPRGWCSSSPQTLFRMLSFAGILSVSLTVLANRNLLLVHNDPNYASQAPFSANSFINWNSRDAVSVHYRKERVSSSSSLSSSSTSASSLLLQYPSTSEAAAAAAVAATRARWESNAASPPLLRGKDKKIVSSSRLLADPSTSAGGRGASTVTSDPTRVRLPATNGGSVPAKASEHVSIPTLLMPQHHRSKSTSDQRKHLSGVVLPKGKLVERHFESQDRNIYTYHVEQPASEEGSSSSSTPNKKDRRVAILHESWRQHRSASTAHQAGRGSMALTYPRRKLRLYPPDFTDPTQLYGVLDSGDERVKMMERRPPLVQGECVPMQEWQTTFHPSCNQLHESIDLASVGATRQQTGTEFDLFGTKGYWRNAWKVNSFGPRQLTDTVVLKTLKIEHRFEEKVYEHNRIDAIAMERLTSSPHVINVFGFCGNSVVTEYADGKRLGELADKSKKVPLARLRIARDIAQGLADVHGIDGDGNATFVHLDINPANVVSIGGTLKLNDFNIGIIRRWNTTSNEPCGFAAQYPNPQWRSPEEARGQSNLTEKVDVFSMGHIFFRLICGHEPWNKLEPGGKPSKAEMNEKVERGQLPTIPMEIRHSKDPEEVAIRDAMLRCYRHDPARRPSARDIAVELQRTLDRLDSEQQATLAAAATAADSAPPKAEA